MTMSIYGKPKLRSCIDCRRFIGKNDKKTGAFIPVATAYPYCAQCFSKRIHDPGFKQWLVKVLGGMPKFT